VIQPERQHQRASTALQRGPDGIATRAEQPSRHSKTQIIFVLIIEKSVCINIECIHRKEVFFLQYPAM
jgi:hypothetical protein